MTKYPALRIALPLIMAIFICNTTLYGAKTDSPYLEIPYLIEPNTGLPLIKVSIGGLELRMIFDTGSSVVAVKGSVMHEIGSGHARRGRKVTISDANGSRATYETVKFRHADFCGIEIKNCRAVILPEDNHIFACLNVDGITGSFFMAGKTVMIDSQRQLICVAASSSHFEEPDNGWHKMKHNSASQPELSLSLFDSSGSEVHEGFAMFDTGDNSTYIALKGNVFSSVLPVLNDVENTIGSNIISINGMGNPTALSRATIPYISIGGIDIKNAGVRSGRNNIIGMSLTMYGKIVLDFVRDRYCFIPFSECRQWNTYSPSIETAIIDNRLMIAAVWDDQLQQVLFPGDIIISIANETLGAFDRCTPVTLDLLIYRYDPMRQNDVTISRCSNMELVIPSEAFSPAL